MNRERGKVEITVAMSMHNSAEFLRECIDSILAQSFEDFELLIADDGSSDESVEIVRSYGDERIRLICREHDFIGSLNALLEESRGRYIARMDSDDVMMRDRLRKEFEYLEARPETAAVCTAAIRIKLGEIWNSCDICKELSNKEIEQEGLTTISYQSGKSI